MKYVCELCGMIYDEDLGDIKHHIPAGTKFEDLPADYECPGCYSEREAFSPCQPNAARRITVAKGPEPAKAYLDGHYVSDR